MNDAKRTLADKIIAIKKKKKWTWTQIAERIGMSPVWTTAALLGQMSMLEPQAKIAAEIIQEEFGDGIMSAIDFDLQMERKADTKVDRVKITMAGKFLPYKRY